MALDAVSERRSGQGQTRPIALANERARVLGVKTSESILTIDDLADRLDSLLTRKDKQPK